MRSRSEYWTRCKVVVAGLMTAVGVGVIGLWGADTAAAIQGGSSASDMAPSVARITYQGKLDCTGSVAGNGWILTAYHCLTDINGDWGAMRVELWRAGTIGTRSDWSSAVRQPRSMAAASAPSGAKTGYRDVMLLQTKSVMPSWAKTVPMSLTWPAIGTSLTSIRHEAVVGDGVRFLVGDSGGDGPWAVDRRSARAPRRQLGVVAGGLRAAVSAAGRAGIGRARLAGSAARDGSVSRMRAACRGDRTRRAARRPRASRLGGAAWCAARGG